MNVPRPTMEKNLKAEEKELSDDIKNLEKKVHRNIYVRLVPFTSTDDSSPRASTSRNNSTTPKCNYET